METVPEIEDKYEVGPGFVVPPLAGAVAGVAAVGEPRVDDLLAVYYDTADFRLARSKMVLRRRRGGPDAGWHLKLPAGSGRTEIRRALGRGERVPADMSDLVFAHTRGAPLAPVARLATNRTTYALLDGDGVTLAEIADDQVHAEVFADYGRGVEISAWRELEIELVDGPRALLKAAGRALLTAGAEPSARPSKFGGLIAGRVTHDPEPASPARPVSRRGPAREVIETYLAEQTERLLEADLRLRLDEPDAVHDMRVASRRIRSILKTFRPMLDAGRARDLEERLRAVGLQLGAARDSEVLLERLLGFVDGLPETFVLGPVRRRLNEQLHGEYLQGRTAALTYLRSDAYAELLEDLIAFVHSGFIPAAGGGVSRKALAKMVRRSGRKLVRRVEAAHAAAQGEEREHALHQARKAAKQARYAAEAAAGAFGGAAARMAKHAKAIQELLGEHQDSVVAAGVLRDLGVSAHGRDDESAFTFGLLAGLERAYAAQARRQFDALWSKRLAGELSRRLR